MENKDIDDILRKLSNSKFRSNFKLNNEYIEYINNKGIDKIRAHAYDFITKRISSKNITNDGRQTPMKGHPVFLAQHATATCCRECINKWHGIKKGKELTKNEIDYLVSVIMKWIEKQMV